VEESEERPERPAARVHGGEDRVVDEREELAGHQVHHVSERLRARAIACHRGAEQEGQVDASEAQLVGRSQARGQYQGADEAAGEGTPETHVALALEIDTAALMRAR
jgi:hypothetical protein